MVKITWTLDMSNTIWFEVVLLLLSIQYGIGQVVFTLNEKCYNVNDNLIATATYTGTGTPTGVEWYYSNGSTTNIYLLFSNCNLFGGVTDGYPVRERFDFQCHNESSYTMTLYNLTETELNGYQWGAVFRISGTLNKTAAEPKLVSKCEITTPEPCPCPWWCILLIVICCLLYLCGIGIGIFMFCCKDEPCNKIYVGDRIPCWVFPLIIIIVGLGILTVFAICYFGDWFGCCACCVECCCGCCDDCCGSSNAKNESEPDPMQEKMKMAEDLAPRDQDKNAL